MVTPHPLKTSLLYFDEVEHSRFVLNVRKQKITQIKVLRMKREISTTCQEYVGILFQIISTNSILVMRMTNAAISMIFGKIKN